MRSKVLSVTGLGVEESSVCSNLMQAGETYLGISVLEEKETYIDAKNPAPGWYSMQVPMVKKSQMKPFQPGETTTPYVWKKQHKHCTSTLGKWKTGLNLAFIL